MPVSPVSPVSTVSQRKIDANRRNAEKSTGPRTPNGKARSSQNALTHGLFCAHLVHPGEDETSFHHIRDAFIKRLRPNDPLELMLVDRIVGCTWKLRRLQEAELKLHESSLLERRQHIAKATPDHTPAETMLASIASEDGVLERLSRYEQRLSHQMHRTLRELQRLQESRKKRGNKESEANDEKDAIEENEPTARDENAIEHDTNKNERTADGIADCQMPIADYSSRRAGPYQSLSKCENEPTAPAILGEGEGDDRRPSSASRGCEEEERTHRGRSCDVQQASHRSLNPRNEAMKQEMIEDHLPPS